MGGTYDPWDHIRPEMKRERDALRAQLQASTERAEKAESELESHVGKQALKEMLRQLLRNAEEKERLAASNARLRAALEAYASEENWMHACERDPVCRCLMSKIKGFEGHGWELAAAALTETTAASAEEAEK